MTPITLPFQCEGAKPAFGLASGMQARATPEGERVFQILVIDDNEGDARLFQEAWAECKLVNATVSLLKDSKDAIVYLRGVEPYTNAAVPDLVLLDYKMPVDGGIALTEIKAVPITCTFRLSFSRDR